MKTIAIIILLAALSRLLPHPDNFTPLAALAFLAGRELKSWILAISIPFGAMLLSDYFLGLDTLSPVVYFSFLISIFFGRVMMNKSFGTTTLLVGANSIVFFVLTNFAVWLWSGMYPLTSAGLMTCFTMAIPFYHWSLAGDLFYSGILLGGVTMLKQQGLLLTANNNAQ